MKQYENETIKVAELRDSPLMDSSMSGNYYIERATAGRLFKGNVFEFVKEVTTEGLFEDDSGHAIFDVDIEHGVGDYPEFWGYINQWNVDTGNKDEGTVYPLPWSVTGGDISFSIGHITKKYINVQGFVLFGTGLGQYKYQIKLRLYKQI